MGKAEVDLYYERDEDETAVEVLDIRGDLHVRIVDDWPATAAITLPGEPSTLKRPL